MGYTRFEHDIFLSYVRADDEGTRWVSQFEEELRIALMHRGSKQITLWRDTRELKRHHEIDSTIKGALDSTALLVALNSVLYPQSEYCRDELQYFLQRADGDGIGRQIGTANRWFNVLQYNIPRHGWLRDLDGAPAYPFHDAGEDGRRRGNGSGLAPSLPLLREDPCSPMPAGAETQLENATATIISSEDEVAISRYRKGVPIGLV